jgi:hypothetical protein
MLPYISIKYPNSNPNSRHAFCIRIQNIQIYIRIQLNFDKKILLNSISNVSSPFPASTILHGRGQNSQPRGGGLLPSCARDEVRPWCRDGTSAPASQASPLAHRHIGHDAMCRRDTRRPGLLPERKSQALSQRNGRKDEWLDQRCHLPNKIWNTSDLAYTTKGIKNEESPPFELWHASKSC